MSDQRFEFKVASVVPASYTLTADELIYKQGVRTQRVALAAIHAFAVRTLPAAPLAKPLGELTLDVTVPGGPRRRRKFAVVIGEPACQAMVTALGARLPHADLTRLPWPEAAARLGVSAVAPWYADWRIVGGLALIVAAAVAVALPTRPAGGSELAGYLGGGIAAAVGGVVMLVIGLAARGRAR